MEAGLLMVGLVPFLKVCMQLGVITAMLLLLMHILSTAIYAAQGRGHYAIALSMLDFDHCIGYQLRCEYVSCAHMFDFVVTSV